MKANDWANPDPARQHIVDSLSELCHHLGLSFTYTEHSFRIKLPEVIEQPIVAPHKSKKRLNMSAFDELSNWLAQQNDDNPLPDELPPSITPLDEGEKPEDPDAED